MAKATAPRGMARGRVLDAAMTLFERHGIAGTSLQMIADEVGVTKAAVYFQFHTKDEIVAALLERPLAQLNAVLDKAEGCATREEQIDVTLRGLIDLVLENRLGTSLIQRDPSLRDILDAHGAMEKTMSRLLTIMIGANPEPRGRVALAVYGAGLLQVGTDARLADLDEDVVRVELLAAGRRILAHGK
jgi:AcrR family transcriptional regulator